MNLRQLEHFIAVAEHGNVTRAAARIHLSQSALSRQIANLEGTVGCKLFHRTTAGFALTEAGENLRRRLTPLLRELRSLGPTVRAQDEPLAGEVVFGIPPSLRRILTLPLLAELHRAFPKIRYGVEQGTTYAMSGLAQRGEADFVVISDVERTVGLATRPLVSEQMVLVGARQKIGHLRSVTKAQLRRFPLIVTPPRNSLRILVERAIGRRIAGPRPAIQVTTPELMLDLAAAGVGFAVLPGCAIHERRDDDGLAAVPIAGMRIGWVLANPRHRALTAAATATIATLTSLLEELVRTKVWSATLELR